MGTNYYWHEQPDCPTCGQDRGRMIHIGKSSAGWCFGLATHPDLGIKSLDDWRQRFRISESVIRDEYGNRISPSRMLEVITEREWGGPPDARDHDWYFDNHATPGPRGLARRESEGL